MTKKKRTILIIIIILTGLVILGAYLLPIKGKSYNSWKQECKYVNENYKCGIYNCSIIGYYNNYDLCRN